MQKTIGDMASYMRQLLPADISEDYPIDPLFTEVSSQENIRTGILGFRNFMDQIYGCLIEEPGLADIPRKGKKKFSDETTLTVEFPFLNNIKSILINVGYRGILSEENNSILIKGWDDLSLKSSLNKGSTTKLSLPQMLKTLRFLKQCGLHFEGVDLSEKKADVSEIESIQVTYPKNPMVLVGWKVLGLAQYQLATRKNDDILLRCDYKILSQMDHKMDILHEFVRPLSKQLKDFILSSHHRYLDFGMTCQVEQGFFCTHFIYSYKRKAIWRFSASFHNGYRIILKTKNTEKYPEVINRFPIALKDRILKGYGCDRKAGSGHGNCQRGCEGFSFPLDDTLINMSQSILLWQECELSSMKK